MEKKPLDITFKQKLHPLLGSLPPYLKDPANYHKIQTKILNTFKSTCAHSEVYEWATCEKCTAKMLKRRKLLRELGFKNPAQYMAWRKTHETIIEKFPLVDWSKKQLIQ